MTVFGVCFLATMDPFSCPLAAHSLLLASLSCSFSVAADMVLVADPEEREGKNLEVCLFIDASRRTTLLDGRTMLFIVPVILIHLWICTFK